ncbi:hypothetical protein ACSBR2_040799 [Camellia fascicularis]
MSMTTTEKKPPRKFPPPCWTQEETLALIDVYRERWYALRRGYLRTADWDAVAAAVVTRCPDASPSKTSAQCRHKMEKLRQKYRTEKQRSLSFPGRFFSSWFFFDNMDSMSLPLGSNQNANNRIESGVESVKKIDGNSSSNLGLGEDGVGVDRNSVILGLRAKNYSKIDANSNPNCGSTVLNGHSSYLDEGSDEDVGDDTDFQGPIRSKKFEKIHGNFGPNFDSDGGFYIKPPMDQDLVPPGFRAKKFNDRYSIPTGIRSKSSGKTEGNSCPNLDSRFVNGNGFSSTFGLGLGKKTGGGGRGVKRERGEIAEMASAIKVLGEGFVKMEKMKMEMAGEIEKMRMEMEMKRNELILESQRQIVDAFVTVLQENKKKKVNTMLSPES